MWQQLLLLVAGVALIAMLYFQIKKNPQAFSKKSLGQSFWTMGLLAIALIIFIAFLIMLVRR